MKKQLYIPTQDQRIRIYDKIQQNKQSQQQQQPINNQNINTSNIDTHNIDTQKILSKEQLKQLLNRLTKDTKKQLFLQSQIKQIKDDNLEIKRKNRQKSKIEERLLLEGKKLQEKKQKMKIERQKEINSQLRNIPQISEKAKGKEMKPIHQRIDEIINQKNLLNKNLEQKYQPKFRPSIDEYSNFIAQINKDCNGNFLKRMEQFKINCNRKSQAKRKQLQDLQNKQLKFQPHINKVSKQMNSEEKMKIQGKSLSKKYQQQKYSYIPRINRHSSLIANKNSNKQSCYQRLYNQSKTYKNNILEKKEMLEKQMTFKPVLNNKSRLIIQNKKSCKEQSWYDNFVQINNDVNVDMLYQKLQS